MGFRDADETSSYQLVQFNHATGKREVVSEVGIVEGRWAADAAMKKLMEANRDPSVTFEVQEASKLKPKFRAAAFGDRTGQMPAMFNDDEKKS